MASSLMPRLSASAGFPVQSRSAIIPGSYSGPVPNAQPLRGDLYYPSPDVSEPPVTFFPVLFAIPRTVGRLAQRQEMLKDPKQKIARPRQIYTGYHECN